MLDAGHGPEHEPELNYHPQQKYQSRKREGHFNDRRASHIATKFLEAGHVTRTPAVALS
jgi:hypothetical protein